MKRIVIFCISCLLLSCAGAKKTGVGENRKPVQGSTQFDESFDPLSLNDDDIIITEKKKTTVEQATDEKDKASADTTEEAVEKEVDGWRVQILATSNIENATLIHQEALDQFSLSDIKAYLIFEAPLYKVRIGDATNQNNAQTIRDLARDYGYVEAFIVRSKVLVQSGLNFLDD